MNMIKSFLRFTVKKKLYGIARELSGQQIGTSLRQGTSPKTTVKHRRMSRSFAIHTKKKRKWLKKSWRNINRCKKKYCKIFYLQSIHISKRK